MSSLFTSSDTSGVSSLGSSFAGFFFPFPSLASLGWSASFYCSTFALWAASSLASSCSYFANSSSTSVFSLFGGGSSSGFGSAIFLASFSFFFSSICFSIFYGSTGYSSGALSGPPLMRA